MAGVRSAAPTVVPSAPSTGASGEIAAGGPVRAGEQYVNLALSGHRAPAGGSHQQPAGGQRPMASPDTGPSTGLGRQVHVKRLRPGTATIEVEQHGVLFPGPGHQPSGVSDPDTGRATGGRVAGGGTAGGRSRPDTDHVDHLDQGGDDRTEMVRSRRFDHQQPVELDSDLIGGNQAKFLQADTGRPTIRPDGGTEHGHGQRPSTGAGEPDRPSPLEAVTRKQRAERIGYRQQFLIGQRDRRNLLFERNPSGLHRPSLTNPLDKIERLFCCRLPASRPRFSYCCSNIRLLPFALSVDYDPLIEASASGKSLGHHPQQCAASPKMLTSSNPAELSEQPLGSGTGRCQRQHGCIDRSQGGLQTVELVRVAPGFFSGIVGRTEAGDRPAAAPCDWPAAATR